MLGIMGHAPGAYLPLKTRSQASLQRALIAISAATEVAYNSKHASVSDKHK